MIDPTLSMMVRNDEPEYVKQDDWLYDPDDPVKGGVVSRADYPALDEAVAALAAVAAVSSAGPFRLPDARHRCP